MPIPAFIIEEAVLQLNESLEEEFAAVLLSVV